MILKEEYLPFGSSRAISLVQQKGICMDRSQHRTLGWLLAAAFTAGTGATLWAQDAEDQQHSVARISVIDGQASVRRGDSGEWVAGIINAPLLADDHISTGPNSRAEVEFDAANLLRLGGTAEIKINALETARLQVELSHGTITYRVLRPSSANAEVDTPNISIRLTRIGVYRISVGESGETELAVRAGDAEVFSPRGSQWVNAGQMMIARGVTSDPEFQMVALPAPDAWDAWSDSRDRALTQSRSVERVPQGVSGSEDLDNYGDWVNTPDYGYVWQPQVSPGWAPYQVGQWQWLDWYGWTWVSADPWGWAPYHYGRWFWRANLGWLWYPGVFGVPHYWCPALVGFFGFGGGGFGLGFGFGHVGWVPLAPYEVFHPWWGRGYYGSGRYINRTVNITNVNIRNTYRNAGVVNGVSGMSVHDFQNGHGTIVRPTGAQLQSAGLIHGAVPLAAGSAATRFSSRPAAYIPRNTGSTSFFHAQQAATAGRSSYGSGATNRIAPEGGTAARPASGGAAGGWRRFGAPGTQSAPSNAASAGTQWHGSQSPAVQNTRPSSPSSGWQRFGQPNSGYRNSPYSGTGGQRYEPPARGAPSQPRYSAPSNRDAGQPRYSPPSQPRQPQYRAPQGGGGHPSGGGATGRAPGPSRSSGGGHSHR